jgi:hypothetical protein
LPDRDGPAVIIIKFESQVKGYHVAKLKSNRRKIIWCDCRLYSNPIGLPVKIMNYLTQRQRLRFRDYEEVVVHYINKIEWPVILDTPGWWDS